MSGLVKGVQEEGVEGTASSGDGCFHLSGKDPWDQLTIDVL